MNVSKNKMKVRLRLGAAIKSGPTFLESRMPRRRKQQFRRRMSSLADKLILALLYTL